MNDDKTIKGVFCDADSCVYHTKSNKCSADSVKVSTNHFGKFDPDCATYKSCDNCGK